MSDTLPALRGLRCDVFCRVIDNFGDAGVCWRLVRELRLRYGWRVRIIIDDLDTLARLAPQVRPGLAIQHAEGIDIARWSDPLPPDAPADVVIEAFACEIPPAYAEAMARRSPVPHWINLEYLSAESWVEECHGLASRHPQLGLTKRFFFPGFTARSGGVLIGGTVENDEAAFRADPTIRDRCLRAIGADPDVAFTALAFCYPTPAFDALIDAWENAPVAMQCLVPRPATPPGVRASGRVAVLGFDFVAQTAFDDLLRACDFVIVRGEDSFVRAQLTARVFLWHIYPQTDDAHLVKLRAFIARYTESLDPAAASAWAALNLAWNEGRHADLGPAWRAVRAHWAVLQAHAWKWQTGLLARGDLTLHLGRLLADRLQ